MQHATSARRCDEFQARARANEGQGAREHWFLLIMHPIPIALRLHDEFCTLDLMSFAPSHHISVITRESESRMPFATWRFTNDYGGRARLGESVCQSVEFFVLRRRY